MDSQLSPEDYALLDDNTSTIPGTPNSFGRSLIRRLGLAETETASSFLSNTNIDNTGIALRLTRAAQSIDKNLT